MTTPLNPDPMTICLLTDSRRADGEAGCAVPHPIPGVVDFSLTVENPEVNEERDDARRVNPRRAQQLRRRRRANPGDIALTLDYDPMAPAHQELLAAGESEARLTLRIIVQDAAGQLMSAQDVDCSVLRYTLSCRQTRRRRLLDDGRLYTCDAELRLQRQSGFRPAPLLDAAEAELYRRWPPARVPCPACGQPAGHPCVTASGNEANDAHAARRQLLAETSPPVEPPLIVSPA